MEPCLRGLQESNYIDIYYTICVHPLYVLENGGVLECYTGNWLHEDTDISCYTVCDEDYPSTSTGKLEEILIVRMIDDRTIGFPISVCIGKRFRK